MLNIFLFFIKTILGPFKSTTETLEKGDKYVYLIIYVDK